MPSLRPPIPYKTDETVQRLLSLPSLALFPTGYLQKH